jgi:ParB-like chromosome segregation protein Spo0J
MNVERIAIADLSFDPANARKHGERNLAAITASLRRFGQQTPIVIDKSNVVRKGNGTLQAAIAMGWDSIDCIRTELTSSDAIAYAIADNRTSELAEWDDDVLAAQLNGLLADDPDLLDAAGFDEDELAELLGDLDDDGKGGEGTIGIDDDTYTAKIVAPIYEPKGECPAVADLFDRKKTADLVAGIKAANLPKETAEFLLLAAERHTAFHFRNIAEFYCHASAEVQDLMERSGLVIIDFKKAIEYGFVHMTERLGQLADLEESDNADA